MLPDTLDDFETNVLLPAQLAPSRKLRGEERLLFEMLEGAEHDLGITTARAAAICWFWSLLDGPEPVVSFEYCCDVFDYDADQMRTVLARTYHISSEEILRAREVEQRRAELQRRRGRKQPKVPC